MVHEKEGVRCGRASIYICSRVEADTGLSRAKNRDESIDQTISKRDAIICHDGKLERDKADITSEGSTANPDSQITMTLSDLKFCYIPVNIHAQRRQARPLTRQRRRRKPQAVKP